MIEGQQIRLPHVGFVPLREALRFDGRIMGATVSLEAGRWFVAVQVAVEDAPIQRENQAPVGIDLGIAHAATLSMSRVYDAPKSLAKNLRKLRRLSRGLSRKVEGSRNREKAQMQLARLHRRIALMEPSFAGLPPEEGPRGADTTGQGAFIQGYNAQVAVDGNSQIIVAATLTNVVPQAP